MINYLKHMAIFSEVVALGSFRLTAKKLGVAPSRISHAISDLEQFLGVTLLHRTTRKLSLTAEGEKFYKHVVKISESAEAGVNELNSENEDPIGKLNISLPAFLAFSKLSTTIAKFIQKYPKVSLSLNYTDQVMNVMDESIDVSIRAGWLEDSSLIARKISEGKRILVGGRDFVASNPSPTHPRDLKGWEWIHFSMRGNIIEFTSPLGEIVSISEKSRIDVNSASAISHLAQSNLGLAILPEHIVQTSLTSGKLVRVLPEWELKPLGYYAVWPKNSSRGNLTMLFVSFLVGCDLSVF